jgi:hypothetical protein
MFKKASDKKAFTAEDIERYHRGLMSAAERNALERAALEDALLEEALEGYTGLPPGQSARDLAMLKARLDKRVSGSGRRLSVWWRVAAAGILLAGGAAYLRWGAREPVKDIAVLARKVEPPAPAVAAPVATPHASASADVARPSTPRKAVRRPVRVETRPSVAPLTLAQPPREAKYKANTEKDSTPIAGNAADVSVKGFGTAKSMAGIMARDFKRFSYDNRVTDTNNRPIVAIIQLLSGGRGVVTDQNGYFRISTPDTQARVMVTSVGYEPRQYYAYELKNVPSVQLLPSNTDMDEVVVTTLDVRKKKAAEKFPSLDDSTTAQPEIGWGGYDDYLVSNLQLPDEAVLHHIHGEVDLSFQVDPLGKPVNISVVKSLCNPCDAEAVRLLERGPHWKKGTKDKRGNLKIHF